MPVCFITGAAHRLGKNLAIEFARKKWDIIIHYHQIFPSETIKLVEETGVKYFLVNFDLRDSQKIKESFEKIKSEFYVPNVLINNAAIFPQRKSLSEMQEDDWDDVLNINLRSIFVLSREFSKIAVDDSKIINIASEGAHKIWKQRIAYNVSKSGVITLTKALARELAPKIAVNSVSPGYIQYSTGSENEIIPKSRIPMQRYATPQDIFEVVYFLANTTNYLTGQDIIVDGGLFLV